MNLLSRTLTAPKEATPHRAGAIAGEAPLPYRRQRIARSGRQPREGRSAGRAQVSAAAVDARNATLLADEDLLRQAAEGCAVAGELLVRRYSAPLLRYLNRLAGLRFAEDLHQQTWLSVFTHSSSFDPSHGGGFKAWLFRIASNKVTDFWRSRARERAAKEGMMRMFDEELPDSSQATELSEQAGKLRRAMEQLPEVQRQVLVLRFYEKVKFVDIAEMLGCPLNTALGRAHKGLLNLRKLMEQA